MNTVLVCGGAGYIGSMTSKLLSKAGYEVVVVDDLRCGHKFLVKYGKLEVANIGDMATMDQIIKKYRPILVMNFAAVASVPEANQNPWECYNNNVSSTNNLLKVMIENNVLNFVFSSTAALFGQVEGGRVVNSTKINPVSIYGKSKSMVEDILSDYAVAYNLKYASLRYFNVSGADPELEVGECHLQENHLIPTVIDKAYKGEVVEVFGHDYNTKDGTCIRDYVHVYDVANAHVLALKYLLLNNKSIKVNLGNNNGFSVNNIIDLVQKVTEIDFKVKYVSKREGDPDILISDNTQAFKILGWKPKYEDPEIHIKHAWEWYKIYHNVNK